LLPDEIWCLFDYFKTNDFELVLRLFWQAHNINRALRVPDDKTYGAYQNIRDCLITAVRDVHLEHDNVREALPKIHDFLMSFRTVISLNYDLLVYWATTYGLNFQSDHVFKDCFPSGVFDDNWQRFRQTYREKSNTLVFYPHGNLILCRNTTEQERKVYIDQEDLLRTIFNEWRKEQIVPLFVSEGTSSQKISAIRNSHYLSTVYREVLTEPKSTLTIFGWSMGEQDHHLLRQMTGIGIQRVAVSVFRKNQDYCHHACQVIHRFFGGHVHVDFFESESSECWINKAPSNY